MKVLALTPIVLGILASTVITGCSKKDPEPEKKPQPCEYKITGGNEVNLAIGTAYSKPVVKVMQEKKEITYTTKGSVDSKKLGTYIVTYEGKSCSNKQNYTVKVVPSSCSYKLSGANPLELAFGKKYVEPGFEVKDFNNKVLKESSTGAINSSKEGSYTLTYKGEGCSNTAKRMVKVLAKVVPAACTYTLSGLTADKIALGNTYKDPGVSVRSSKNEIVSDVVKTGIVNSTKAGTYTIEYKGKMCTNSIKRTVKVFAEKCQYTLLGKSTVEMAVGKAYQEPGVVVKGSEGEDIKDTATLGTVNTKKEGSYTLEYKSKLCSNSIKRTVNVVSASCTYTLKGEAHLFVDKGSKFTDPGLVVKDHAGKIVNTTTKGSVDTGKLGDSTLEYNGAGCVNTEKRTVTVALPKCEYKLHGASPLVILKNSTYADPGVDVKDKEGKVIKSKLIGTGAVDTAKLGRYIVSYKIEGCANTQDRIVNVKMPTNEELGNGLLPEN